MAEILKERKDVDVSLTWDLSLIYPTIEDYEKDLKTLTDLSFDIEKEYKGKLNTAAKINECLDKIRELYRMQELTGSYVQLALSVDYADVNSQERYAKIMNLFSDIDSRLSFIESEIIVASDEVLDEAISICKENSNHLKDIKRKKEHRLHPEAERVLAALSGVLEAPYDIYEQTKSSDMDFKSFEVKGVDYPLGYAMFENQYEYEVDTDVRRAAFNTFSEKLREYQYTTGTAYNTQLQKEKILSKLRGFNSVIDSLLFNQKVDRDLYNRQIDLITEKLAPHMRKYARLIKKVHNLDKMTFADLKLAVDPEFDPNVTIEQSKDYILDALSILGDDYLDMVKKAYDERWIDFANNKGKSTGGFCASPHGCNSFILLSWSEKMSEVFTLAHELGHAGHFRLCNKNNSIFDTNISNYFVEAPSTMNELLMANHLLKTNDDKRFRRWVLPKLIPIF